MIDLPPIPANERRRIIRTGFNRREFMKTKVPTSYDWKEPTYVYAFRCEKYVKIGVAADIPKRMKALVLCNPFPIVVERADLYGSRLEAMIVEKAAHRALVDKHHHGEWFTAKPERVDRLLSHIFVASHDLFRLHNLERQERAEQWREANPHFSVAA